MIYFVTFLEGFITFISPCLLPMVPLYLSYLAYGEQRKRSLLHACGFVFGFTISFVLMGGFAGSIGALVKSHQTILNLVCGIVVIMMGATFLDLIHFPKLIHTSGISYMPKKTLFSSIVFGMVFSIAWTPCLGTFLGSALMLASQQAHLMKGILLLLLYSLGLGIPFIMSAVLLDSMKQYMNWMKQHYDVINRVSGWFLIIVGILMGSGILQKLLALIS